ncbi:MAG: NAD kinase [Holosporales bacterium]|jgi:NAD+ kinase
MTMRITFLAAATTEAETARHALEALYPPVPMADAEVLIVLGGDGFMLEALHRYHHHPAPLYGMNLGSVGFLLNPYRTEHLQARILAAHRVNLPALRMTVQNPKEEQETAIAFNEVSLLRQTHQAAKIRILVDDIERLQELVCDGALLATPAGSTAYNLSAHGPILPLESNLLALTPIAAFRPRRWRGALLPSGSTVTFEILNPDKRPVAAVADSTEFRNIRRVSIRVDPAVSKALLFDPEQTLAERILKEQFGA